MGQDDHMKQVRTRVDESVWDALDGMAALAGTSMAGYVRDVLTAHVGGSADIGGSDTGSMTAEERVQWKRWSVAVTDEPVKVQWRQRVDAVLRKQGKQIPPLPTDPADHAGLIAWAHAVHPFTRAAGSADVPPRWVK